MEEEFSYHDSVPRQILLEIADVFETLFPNVFAYESRRQLLFCQEFGMHPYHQHLLIVTAIKDANLTAIRQVFHAPPKIIVIQIFG